MATTRDKKTALMRTEPICPDCQSEPIPPPRTELQDNPTKVFDLKCPACGLVFVGSYYLFQPV